MLLSTNGTLQFIADNIKEYLFVTKRKSVIINLDGTIGSLVNMLACYLGNIPFATSSYLLQQSNEYKEILSLIIHRYNHTRIDNNDNPSESVTLLSFAQEDIFPIRRNLQITISENSNKVPCYAPLIPFVYAELVQILHNIKTLDTRYFLDQFTLLIYDYAKYGGISIIDNGSYLWSDIEKLNKFFINNSHLEGNNTSNLQVIQSNILFTILNDDLKNFIHDKNIKLEHQTIRDLYSTSVKELEFIPLNFYYNFSRPIESVAPNMVP